MAVCNSFGANNFYPSDRNYLELAVMNIGLRNGLDSFQPKDARAVEKTTGKVDIRDQSDSESDSDNSYQKGIAARGSKTKTKKGGRSRNSSESSTLSSSSDNSAKRGTVQKRYKESPHKKDSRGQPIIKSSPPEAGRGMAPRPYVYNRQNAEDRGEQQEAQEPVETSEKTSAAENNARPKSSVQRQTDANRMGKTVYEREERKEQPTHVENDSPQNKAVSEEVRNSIAPGPARKVRRGSASSSASSSSVSSSENSDSDNEERKKAKDNDVVDSQKEKSADEEDKRAEAAVAVDDEEDKASQGTYEIPVGESADATDGAEKSRETSYQGPVSVEIEAQEENEDRSIEYEGRDEERTAPPPLLPVVMEEKEKEEATEGVSQQKDNVTTQEESVSTVQARRRGSDASSSSSSSTSSSSSAGSAAINDKGPNTQNDPTVVFGEEKESTEAEKKEQVVITSASREDTRKALEEEKKQESGSSDSESDSDDESSSSSNSDTEKQKRAPPTTVNEDAVIETTAQVHYSDEGENEKTENKPDPDSDPEATHGGNDPDNVANDLGSGMVKPVPPVVAPLPREGSILPLLEKSVNTVEVNAVTLNKTQVYEAAQFLEKKDRINQLNFVNCGIDDDDVQKLMEALKESPSKPVLLNLSLNPLTVGCVDHILNILANKPSIEAVLLQGTRLGDEGVEKLVDGILSHHQEKRESGDLNQKELKELDLSDSKFGDQGAQALARLIMSGMEIDTITLSSNHAVSCDGWKIIGDALSKNQEIETLTLDHNFIGDEGLDYIAKGLYNNNSVTALDLNDVGITEKGGKCLMELLKRNTTILEITHVGNKIPEHQKEEIKKYISLNKTVRPPL